MVISLYGENDPKTVQAGSKVSWPVKVRGDKGEIKISFEIRYGPDESDAPLWDVTLNDAHGELWSNYDVSVLSTYIDISGNSEKEISLSLICPKGARYGDTAEVVLTASANGSSDAMIFKASASQSLLILKTQISQEISVADSLESKVRDDLKVGETDIYAILCPANLRGYVIVEGMNTDHMREKPRDIRKARSFVDGETTMEQIDHYLTPLSTVTGITEGDIVELVNGPFKGEKARVQKIDQAKEEITVELIEAMVPIPVTVKGDSIRVIK